MGDCHSNKFQGTAKGGFFWFIYGSSLNAEALSAWCREHSCDMPDLAAGRPARLPGYRLAFNIPSKFWGGLVASLVEDPASSAEGLLVPMPEHALEFVHHKEGVLSGLYEEHEMTAETAEGKQPCRVFIGHPARTVAEGPPARDFIATVVAGARADGLSPAWVEKLAALARPPG